MRDALSAAIGADGVLSESAARQYAIRGTVPDAVVAPRHKDDVAAIMRVAAAEGWSILCAGAGTRLGRGNSGRRPDIVLTTSRMSAVTDYEPADLVLTAQAGAPLSQVAAVTARHKQFLALDPAVAGDATIGGVVATASAGPLRFAHGTPRDQVLGLEIVAGDARVLHFGGKVVKNVAGYDVVRPLVGSRGTLGLITEVSVRLKPLPEADRTALISTDAFSSAADLADAIVGARLNLVALEMVSPELAAEIGTEGWTLLARFHGNTESVRDALELLPALIGDYTLQLADETPWRALGALEAAAAWNLRFANLPSRLRETAATAVRTAKAAVSVPSRIVMHAGDGIVRLLAHDAAPTFDDVMQEARAELEAHGGTLIIERAARDIGFDAFGTVPGLGLMAGVKRVFDPAGILAPGSFVA